MMERVRICMDAMLADVQSRGWMEAAGQRQITA
jgi:hypothetical protein